MVNALVTRKTSSLLKTCVCLFTIILAFVLLASSEIASKIVLSSIKLCGTKLIPNIFPFLVISGILTHLGLPELLGRYLKKPMNKLFGVGGVCAAAVITGLICGYPTGAQALYTTKTKGLCTDDDCEKALLISSFASPAFVIGGIGVSLLESERKGFLIWIFHVLATFLVGLLINKISNKSYIKDDFYSPIKQKGVLSSVSVSIKESAGAIISICGSVIFFSVITGYIVSLNFVPDYLKCIFASFIEITSGAEITRGLLSNEQAYILISAAVGWSGMSVISQISLVTENKIKLRKFVFGKALVSILTALLALASLELGII